VTPIRIGLTLPRTGRYARNAGKIYDETYRLWAHEIAERGGLNGQPVELVIYDDESTPARAAELYERLIGVDRVDLLLGPCHSEMVEGIAGLLERERRLLLQGSGSSHELFRKGRRYLYLCWSGCDFDYPRSFLAWASRLPAPHRAASAALVYTDGRIGNAVALGTRHYAPQFGVRLVHDEPITAAPFDYDRLFARVKAAAPDMVLVGLDHTRPDQPAESAVRAYHQAGLDGALLWLSDNPRPGDPVEAFEGAFMRTTWASESTDPVSQQFTDRFVATYGHMPEYHHAGGYACCQVLEQSVRATGSCDSEVLREYVLANAFATIMGELRFQESGLPLATMPLAQYVEGQLRIVYPDGMKTKDASLPPPAAR
jgi:branched-chain amino acid transport system substrate-binding protein